MKSSDEIVGLIDILHKTDARLTELTAGEVDSVMNGEGHTCLLRQAQDQLRDSEADQHTTILELQSVNAGLESFSASVSHDLRGPLCHIQGFVELLQEDIGPALSAEKLGYLETISEAAKRMSTLIEDLLSFSRSAHVELQKTRIDTGQLVNSVFEECRRAAGGREIAWTTPVLPDLWGDRALLRMVLVNLVSNALKFTRGRIRTEIKIGCAAGEMDEVVLFVADNGVGFDQRTAGRLFRVFQRLHGASEFEGSGIGLANVQRIIERHGGRTWAQGIVNGGAIFFFALPKKPQA